MLNPPFNAGQNGRCWHETTLGVSESFPNLHVVLIYVYKGGVN
jgi:hypothetical protein